MDQRRGQEHRSEWLFCGEENAVKIVYNTFVNTTYFKLKAP